MVLVGLVLGLSVLGGRFGVRTRCDDTRDGLYWLNVRFSHDGRAGEGADLRREGRWRGRSVVVIGVGGCRMLVVVMVMVMEMVLSRCGEKVDGLGWDSARGETSPIADSAGGYGYGYG